jgi:tetratricopeptide (TPR) repeat protein
MRCGKLAPVLGGVGAVEHGTDDAQSPAEQASGHDGQVGCFLPIDAAVRRFDEAITAHQTARDIFQETGDRHREAGAWNNLGIAFREMRRFDEARHCWSEAARAYLETGDNERANATRRELDDVASE